MSEELRIALFPVFASMLLFVIYQLIRRGFRLEVSFGTGALWLLVGLDFGGFFASQQLEILLRRSWVKGYLGSVFIILALVGLVLWLVALLAFERPTQERRQQGQRVTGWTYVAFILSWFFVACLVGMNVLVFVAR